MLKRPKRWSLSILGLLDSAKKTQDIQGGFFKQFLAHFFFFQFCKEDPGYLRSVSMNWLKTIFHICKEDSVFLRRYFGHLYPFFQFCKEDPVFLRRYFGHLYPFFQFCKEDPVFLRRFFVNFSTFFNSAKKTQYF